MSRPSPFSDITTHKEARVSPGLFAPRRKLHALFDLLVDLIFPPRCAGCGRVDTLWCDQCQSVIDTIPLTPHANPLEPLNGIASTAVHQGILQSAVQALKYENAVHMGVPLGNRLASRLKLTNWTADMIVPVPLHTTRLAERGYNQAYIIAKQVALQMNVPCVPEALSRQRYTHSQVGLNRQERLANTEDAFIASPDLVHGKTILIIDDVYTTGATLSNCAHAALEVGAVAVYGLTVTVARG